MFLLVPAHPGFPGQIPHSRKTVVLCVCVCNTNNLFPVISHEDSEVDYTYNFCMKRFSIIDHFIVSHFIYECICNVQVLHDVGNFSDHDPL